MPPDAAGLHHEQQAHDLIPVVWIALRIIKRAWQNVHHRQHRQHDGQREAGRIDRQQHKQNRAVEAIHLRVSQPGEPGAVVVDRHEESAARTHRHRRDNRGVRDTVGRYAGVSMPVWRVAQAGIWVVTWTDDAGVQGVWRQPMPVA